MNVIQVGIGGMGNAWLRAVQTSPHVEFAGFVEVNKAIAAEQVDNYGLDRTVIFKSLDEALKNVQADGVINVTPPQFHKVVSITALEAGLPVLSEKPLADTRQAAQEIVEAANRTGVLHMVAQNRRYHTSTQTLKRTLTTGELGEIGAVHVEFFKGPHFGGFREEMAYPLIIDMSIHHFDLMRFFLDSDPVTVFGRSWNPPWSWFKGDASAAVILDFANGVPVSYHGSWCSQARETAWNADWRFECANGVVFMQDEKVYTQATGQEPTPVEAVALERTDQSYLLQEFYEAVTMGKPPVTACQDNIKSLGIVFDVVESFERGAPVRSKVL
jgi:predicted dehydrogenase